MLYGNGKYKLKGGIGQIIEDLGETKLKGLDLI